MSIGISRPDVKGLLRSNDWSRPMCDTRLQNPSNGNMYVFDGADVIEEEVNTDNIEMDIRSRGTKPKSRPKQDNGPVLFERHIEKDDSLLSIALKYGCQVADLKRINNLISDQDFYGLGTIKVPAKKHGLLTELIENESEQNKHKLKLGASQNCDGIVVTNGSDSDATDYDEDISDSSHLLPHENVRTVSIRDAFNRNSGEAVKFLQKMDTDIKNIVTSTKSRHANLDEVTTRLTCRRFFPLEDKKSSYGADCGIRPWSLILCLVIVVIVTPAVYFAYFESLKQSEGTGGGESSPPS